MMLKLLAMRQGEYQKTRRGLPIFGGESKEYSERGGQANERG